MKIDLQSKQIKTAIERARAALTNRSTHIEITPSILRQFGELLTHGIYESNGIAEPPRPTDPKKNSWPIERINVLRDNRIIDEDIARRLRTLWIDGNPASHGDASTRRQITNVWQAFDWLLAELPPEFREELESKRETPEPQAPPPPQPDPQVQKRESSETVRPSLVIKEPSHKPAIALGGAFAVLLAVLFVSTRPGPSPEAGLEPLPIPSAQPTFPVAQAAPVIEPALTPVPAPAPATTIEATPSSPVPPATDGSEAAAIERRRMADAERRHALNDWDRAKQDYRAKMDQAQSDRIGRISSVRGHLENFPLRLAGKQCPFEDRTVPCELTWRAYNSNFSPGARQQVEAINDYEIAVSEAEQRLKLAARKFCGSDSCP